MDNQNNKFYELLVNSPYVNIEIASSRPIKTKIGSEIIMWYQNTTYSHVIVIVNDLVFQASHGLVNVFHMDTFLTENIIVDKISVRREICDFKFLFECLGRKYGFMQLYKIGVNYLLVSKMKFLKKFKYKDNGAKYLICSEYVGKFLKLDWVNDLTDPEDIIKYLLKNKVS